MAEDVELTPDETTRSESDALDETGEPATSTAEDAGAFDHLPTSLQELARVLEQDTQNDTGAQLDDETIRKIFQSLIGEASGSAPRQVSSPAPGVQPAASSLSNPSPTAQLPNSQLPATEVSSVTPVGLPDINAGLSVETERLVDPSDFATNAAPLDEPPSGPSIDSNDADNDEDTEWNDNLPELPIPELADYPTAVLVEEHAQQIAKLWREIESLRSRPQKTVAVFGP